MIATPPEELSLLLCLYALPHDPYLEASTQPDQLWHLSRDANKHAHAFPNFCRHRGTLLIEEKGVISPKRIACPDNVWAGKPDGKLTGMPRAEYFSGLASASQIMG